MALLHNYNHGLFFRCIDMIFFFCIIAANIPLIFRFARQGKIRLSQRKLMMLTLALHDLFLTLVFLVWTLKKYAELSHTFDCTEITLALYWHFFLPGVFSNALITMCAEVVWRRKLRSLVPNVKRLSVIIELVPWIISLFMFLPVFIMYDTSCSGNVIEYFAITSTIPIGLALVVSLVTRYVRISAASEYFEIDSPQLLSEQGEDVSGSDEKIFLSDSCPSPGAYGGSDVRTPGGFSPGQCQQCRGSERQQESPREQHSQSSSIVKLLAKHEQKSLLITSIASLCLTIPHTIFVICFTSNEENFKLIYGFLPITYSVFSWFAMIRPIATPLIWIFNDELSPLHSPEYENCDSRVGLHGQSNEFNDLNTLYSFTGNLDGFSM